MIAALLWFLIGHIIGDFYAQSTTMAHQKKTDRRALFTHILIYSVVILLLGILTFDISYILLAVVLSVVHGLIDYIKFTYTRSRKLDRQQTIKLFAIDQLLHVATILVIIAVSFTWLTTPDAWLTSDNYFIEQFSLSFLQVLQWTLAILIIIKPASIIIRLTLSYFEPREVGENNLGLLQAGEFIGILERLTILILLGAGAYAAIGFVLTAKSIARYNKIAEEPKFAEYYLIGTLMSTFIVLIMFHIIF